MGRGWLTLFIIIRIQCTVLSSKYSYQLKSLSGPTVFASTDSGPQRDYFGVNNINDSQGSGIR